MNSTPRFRLQIVDTDGVVATIPGGGALELDLIESCRAAIISRRAIFRHALISACTEAIIKRGVGLFKIEAHVRQDIEDGLNAVLTVDVQLNDSIVAGITDTIRQLKRKTIPIA